MKRSKINSLIKEAKVFIEKMNFKLPPFAYWTPKDWEGKGSEYDEIRDNMLGWDITDFGSGDFEKTGLLLFTIRNGNHKNKKYQKTYAEKLLISEVGQVTPCHFHWNKMEDIINRGGGELVIEVYNSTKDEKLDNTDVDIYKDGRHYTVPAGSKVRLAPGESITIQQGMYHKFWAEGEKVLIGEVSMVNDDNADNRFYLPAGRFPEIDEDEAPIHYLANEYPYVK